MTYIVYQNRIARNDSQAHVKLLKNNDNGRRYMRLAKSKDDHDVRYDHPDAIRMPSDKINDHEWLIAKAKEMGL